MRADIAARLRRLPKIDTALQRADMRALSAPANLLLEAIRDEVASLRERVLAGVEVGEDQSGGIALSVEAVRARVAALRAPSLRRVINGTGVVLHTNLGRAPLADAALARMNALCAGYNNLEYDLDAGRRGSRHRHLGALLTELTGAEDAAVVNNNAAAVMLCLAALAAGREVVVSRGELVEIGGSFRIPDVMRLSGARLREVGTTNKTRIADYRAALSDDTGMLLKVHQSNFAIVGFTEEASLAEIATLGQESGIATAIDLGSGSLHTDSELAALGLTREPSVGQAVASGIDLVTFSGDKLLGGPQAGIICGRAQQVEACRRHPLMRALRPDKLTMIALEATLSAYRDGRADDEIPTWRMLATSVDTLAARARAIAAALSAALDPSGDSGRVQIERIPCTSAVGGGAMPRAELPSVGLWVRARGLSAHELEKRLRALPTPVIARILGDRVILDMRTVADHDIDELAAGLAQLQAG